MHIKTTIQQAMLCGIHSSYLHFNKQFLSPHTTGKKGEMTSLLTVSHILVVNIHLFIYLGFYVAFNTVQVISRRVVGRAEETST